MDVFCNPGPFNIAINPRITLRSIQATGWLQTNNVLLRVLGAFAREQVFITSL